MKKIIAVIFICIIPISVLSMIIRIPFSLDSSTVFLSKVIKTPTDTILITNLKQSMIVPRIEITYIVNGKSTKQLFSPTTDSYAITLGVVPENAVMHFSNGSSDQMMSAFTIVMLISSIGIPILAFILNPFFKRCKSENVLERLNNG